MAFKFKVAYTVDPNKIQPALDSGTIDAGDLVIINDNGVGKLCFITNDNAILNLNSMVTEDGTPLETIITQVVTEQVQTTITESAQTAVEEAIKNSDLASGSWGDDF